MTPEQKAAFINAQCAMMQAERAIMDAENVERQYDNKPPAHGPDQWHQFYLKWDSVLGHNAVILFFRD